MRRLESVLCVVISGPHLLSRRALMIRIQALVRVALGSRLSHDMRLVCHSSATPISAWYLVTCNGVVAVCKHPYIECVAGSPRFLICCLMIFARCKMSLFMLTVRDPLALSVLSSALASLSSAMSAV